jgi:predicted nucleotidyltransferase
MPFKESRTRVATSQEKERIKRELAARLSREKEVRKVVVFGSFLTSATPNDLDIAIFQDSGLTGGQALR